MADRRTFFITVMAADRPGMMAHIGDALGRLDGRIHDLSQTVLRGYFTVIIYADCPATTTAEALRAALLEGADDLAVGVQAGVGREAPPAAGERLILTVRGPDRPDCVAALGHFLAGRDINIEDLYTRLDPAGSNERVMIAQINAPADRSPRQLQLDLSEWADDLGLTAHLQHENVFLATTEIGAVRTLTL